MYFESTIFSVFPKNQHEGVILIDLRLVFTALLWLDDLSSPRIPDNEN